MAISPPAASGLTNVSLNYCIRWAYDVRDYQIIGPEWARFEVWYDIVAKAGSPAPEKQLKLMLRQLLAERFKLVPHHDKCELPAYALRIEKGGVKWRTSTGKEESAFKTAGRYAYRAENVSIPHLLVFLEPPAGVSRPVVDQTGLEGAFDFTLDLSR